MSPVYKDKEPEHTHGKAAKFPMTLSYLFIYLNEYSPEKKRPHFPAYAREHLDFLLDK